MKINNIDVLLLQRSCNFSWLTDGIESTISIATDAGIASILITFETCRILASNMEAERLINEQKISRENLDIFSWSEGLVSRVKSQVKNQTIYSDFYFPDAVDVSALFSPLRYDLLIEDMNHYRELGRLASLALYEAVQNLRKGMSEIEIAAIVAKSCISHGITPIVNMVAVDERISLYRHPVPTEKLLKQSAMLILCARKYGLIVSLSRTIHIGPLANELKEKHFICSQICALMIHESKIGQKLSNVFSTAKNAYLKANLDGEWLIHHQGGLTGYQTREILATESNHFEIKANQAFAWNPNITGAKSEDTILVSEKTSELITLVGNWPTINCSGIKRADIIIL